MNFSAWHIYLFALSLIFTAALVGVFSAYLMCSLRNGRRVGLSRRWSIPKVYLALLLVSVTTLLIQVCSVAALMSMATNTEQLCTIHTK